MNGQVIIADLYDWDWALYQTKMAMTKHHHGAGKCDVNHTL